MIPIDTQVSRSKVRVKGQSYRSYVGEEGGISVLQTSIFCYIIFSFHETCVNNGRNVHLFP